MADIYSITDLMVEDHKKAFQCLDELEKNLGEDSEKVDDLFNKFKWEIEKHLFVEEKAILIFFNPETDHEYKEIPSIIEEHNTILEILTKIESKIEDNISDISKLKHLLKHHRNFEESTLYPKLDRNLNDEQKKIIVERIKQITC